MSGPSPSSLFRPIAGDGDSRCHVVWFPHAGGGTAAIARARPGLPAGVRVDAALLPGREQRVAEPPYRDFGRLVDDAATALRDRAHAPLALAGHSFGGLLAYFVAGRLALDGVPPQLIQVAAALPPDRCDRAGSVEGMSDAEFAEHLDRRFGGIPPALRADPESLRHFLPPVRADLELMQACPPAPHDAVDVPVMAVGGTDDRLVPPEVLMGWKRFTRGRFSLRSLAGDHFFPLTSFPMLVRAAADFLVAAP